jgi:hypothetical protein
MADDFYPDMYGGDPRRKYDEPAGATPAISPAAAAHKQLGGLKITGSHIKRIPMGDQVLELPTAAYVKLLEDQIRALRNEVRESQTHNRRLANAHNKLVQQMDLLRRELATKLTVRPQ